jgi:hypothetical protein
MILDALLTFSNNQSLAAVAGTYDSNIIDFGGPAIPVLANLQGARDMGIGDDPALKLLVQVTSLAAAGGTSMSVALKGATDNGAGAPSTFNQWWISPVYTTAQMIQGARLMDMDFPRPPAGIAIPRFVKLSFVTIGTFTTLGIWAGIVLDRMDQPYSSTNNGVMGGYPAGINVAN